MLGDCADHLSQGDVFEVDCLGVTSSFTCGVLRLMDKSPFSFVSPKPSHMHFFSINAVKDSLQDFEIIRTSVKRLRRFVIASQTCDIASEDHEPKLLCMVAQVVSLHEFLSSRLPIPYKDGEATKVFNADILDYALQHLSDGDKAALNRVRSETDGLADEFRRLLQIWKDDKELKKDPIFTAFRSRLSNFFGKIVGNKDQSVDYVPPNPVLCVPESFIDLGALYAVPTRELKERRDDRLCTIVSPHKERFSQKLGLHFMRVAV